MHDERLEYLINRCLDGGLTAEEAAELNERILSSPEARRRYWATARVMPSSANGARRLGEKRTRPKKSSPFHPPGDGSPRSRRRRS